VLESALGYTHLSAALTLHSPMARHHADTSAQESSRGAPFLGFNTVEAGTLLAVHLATVSRA
jgi:hypothetical protein